MTFPTHPNTRTRIKCPIDDQPMKSVWYFNIDTWYIIKSVGYCPVHRVIQSKGDLVRMWL